MSKFMWGAHHNYSLKFFYFLFFIFVPSELMNAK